MNSDRNIKKIKLENFRVFKEETEFDLNAFTILTGPNNSGKSALQKLLFLLKNSLNGPGNLNSIDELIFSNEVIQRINLFKDNISFNSSKEQFLITLSIDTIEWEIVDISLTYKKSINSQNAILNLITIKKGEHVLYIFKKIPLFEFAEKYMVDDSLKNEIFEGGIEWPNLMVWSYEYITDNTEELYQLYLDEKKRSINNYFLFKIANKGNRTVLDSQTSEFEELLNSTTNTFDLTRFSEERIDIDFELLLNSCDKYYDRKKEILIPTLLGLTLLKCVDPYSDDCRDGKLIHLRGILKKYGIKSMDHFWQEYKEFELEFIRKSLFSYSYQWPGEGHIDDNFTSLQLRLCFENLFSESYDEIISERGKSLILDKVESTISTILKSKEYQELFSEEKLSNNFIKEDPFSIIRNVKIGENKYDLDIPPDYKKDYDNLDFIHAKFLRTPRLLIHKIDKELKRILKSCTFFFDESNIKQLYFFKEPANEIDQLLIDFANQYLSNNDDYTFKNNLELGNRWLKQFNLGQKLVIKPIKIDENVVGIAYYILKGRKLISMADNGLGTNKLLKLIIRLIVQPSESIVVIEEPEANLHPAFQSKLAELFLEFQKKRNLSFLIETHSEYLIRMFQYLVAKKEVASKEVSIYYLYPPDAIPKGLKQVYRLEIRPDGILKQDFGQGFFDESIRLTMNLLTSQTKN